MSPSRADGPAARAAPCVAMCVCSRTSFTSRRPHRARRLCRCCSRLWRSGGWLRRALPIAIVASRRRGGGGVDVVALLRYRMSSKFGTNRTARNEQCRHASGERIEFGTSRFASSRSPDCRPWHRLDHELFKYSPPGRPAPRAATTNPHNQTFAVAIQLGLIGAAVLWAMWIAHLLLFRGGGLAAWIGLLVVVQNIVGSLFNSYPVRFRAKAGFT